MKKIGINLHAVKGLTDEQYIKTISELGFSATFSSPSNQEKQKELTALFEKYGIYCETLHAPFRNINAIWGEGEDGEIVLETLKHTVDCCTEMGAPIAVVHLSSGEKAPPVTDIGRDRFSRLVEYAASKKVKIAFENQRKLANLAWAMETFDESVAGFCWDCGHEGCFTPGRQYMPLFGNRLICVHLHDNFGVYNQDSHLLPFDGTLDFEKVAAQLGQFPFEGTLMLEVMTENSDIYSDISPIEFLERAAKAARKLTDMVK